jgi:hypothetical protein
VTHAALASRLAAFEKRIALARRASALGRNSQLDLDSYLTAEEKADLADWCARYGDVCATLFDLHRQMTGEERERWRQMLKRRLSLPS